MASWKERFTARRDAFAADRRTRGVAWSPGDHRLMDVETTALRHDVDELLRARDVHESFVMLLAHDLRGPLAAARVASQVLIRGGLSDDVRSDLARRIERHLDRIDRMIADLLDAGRLRAGERLTLHLEACDLGFLALEVADELLPLHGERFIVRAQEGVRGVWSREMLRRALWNLAVNAVKYGAPDGPVTIRVQQIGRTARVSVHNEGTPIPRDEQRQLFAPFARAGSARVSANGWGLGLALVTGCATAHGGRTTVASADGIGTTFTIDLPLDARPFQAVPIAQP